MAVKNSPQLINFNVNGATIPAYRIAKAAGGTAVGRAVALWDTATAVIIGLTQEISSGATGGSVQVAIGGTAKANCGAASVSAGALLTGLTATGEVIEAGTQLLNTTTTIVTRTVGVALQTGDSGAAIEVLVNPNNIRVQFA